MKNTITKGSEVLVLPSARRGSNTEIIVNEDYCIIGKIVSYNASTGAATFTKVWDNDASKTFNGKIKYSGAEGTPTADEVEEDSYLPFFRVGEFNSSGTTDFELRSESAYGYSWVGFVGARGLYARVRWNFTNSSDLSEGELVTYTPSTDTFTASGTAIWIDWKRSAQCQFRTGGDSTIFIVKKILDDVTRSSVERDLYYCAQCFKNEGYELNAFYANAVIAGNKLEVDCLSLDIDDIQSETNAVQTTIVGTAYTNKMLVKIPLDWNTESGTVGNYLYTEISDFGRGLPFLAKPIDPTMEDMETNKYKMPGSVCYYERVD